MCVYVWPLSSKQSESPTISIFAPFWLPNLSHDPEKKVLCQLAGVISDCSPGTGLSPTAQEDTIDGSPGPPQAIWLTPCMECPKEEEQGLGTLAHSEEGPLKQRVS